MRFFLFDRIIGATVTVENRSDLQPTRVRVCKTCCGITATNLTPREVEECVHEHGILERSASPSADRRINEASGPAGILDPPGHALEDLKRRGAARLPEAEGAGKAGPGTVYPA
jgi:hypothetical protein